MRLLAGFHKREDLELLWYRADRGFAVRPGSEEDARLMEIQCVLCRDLASCIDNFYDLHTEGGIEELRAELQRRKIAPEVRRGFELVERGWGIPLLPSEEGRMQETTPPAHP